MLKANGLARGSAQATRWGAFPRRWTRNDARTGPDRHRQLRGSFHRRIVVAASELESEEVVTLPTRLNNVPHLRETREFFYNDVTDGVRAALADGQTRVSVRLTIPETNPEMDVYRVGTLLEMVRTLVLGLAQDGAYVKVCVQQSMGEGVFQGLPLSLVGVRRIMEVMDWGLVEEFVQFGEIRATEVQNDCSYYVLICPQNIIGSTITTDLKEMVEKVEKEGKQMVLINPLLKDVPSSGGVMGIRGRAERMEFSQSFVPAYHFRLLYTSGTYFPIKGALRFVYGGQWQIFKRIRYGKREEGYELWGSFDAQPKSPQITQTIRQKSPSERA